MMASVILIDEIITTKQVLNKWKKPVTSDIMTIKELIKLRIELEIENNQKTVYSFLIKQKDMPIHLLIEQAIQDFINGKFFISIEGYEAKSINDRVFLYRKTSVKFYQII